jgi:regulatory protein
VGEADVAATLAELEAIGELDDARFARRYAEDKRELSGWGAERIREALIARGIGLSEAEAAAETGAGDELARAVELLERRARSLRTDRERASALAYLTRRGFAYELAYDAIHACEARAA